MPGSPESHRPLITCIVPVYNGERFLQEALESILDQTHRSFEITVVDDGSTDGTAAVAGRYTGRIRYLHQANSGPAAARNLGLETARGDLIAFLDADDLWHAEKLERQASHLRAHPETGALFTHAQNFWIDELQEEAERFRGHRISKPIPAYMTSTMMARRTAFDSVGPFDVARKHGDILDWVLRARDAGVAVEMLPDVLTQRRIHQANRSRTLQTQSRDEFLHLLKADLDRRRGG
jgi:glycosyltransferase involved in cell wall biosynthesis